MWFLIQPERFLAQAIGACNNMSRKRTGNPRIDMNVHFTKNLSLVLSATLLCSGCGEMLVLGAAATAVILPESVVEGEYGYRAVIRPIGVETASGEIIFESPRRHDPASEPKYSVNVRLSGLKPKQKYAVMIRSQPACSVLQRAGNSLDALGNGFALDFSQTFAFDADRSGNIEETLDFQTWKPVARLYVVVGTLRPPNSAENVLAACGEIVPHTIRERMPRIHV